MQSLCPNIAFFYVFAGVPSAAGDSLGGEDASLGELGVDLAKQKEASDFL